MARLRGARLTGLLALLLVATACTVSAQPALDGAAGTRAAVATRSAAPSLTPAPSPTVAPPPIPSATPVPTPGQPFALNLYRDGDFVPQYTFDWCVAASVQMAWNMVMPENREQRADQQALWEMARERSSNAHGGANPLGWASVLTEIGVGNYQVVSMGDYEEALRSAARAMRTTNQPVGLVMWRGRHAWVMSGFESLGDPALGTEFTVTGIRVVDPLYPHGSASWGPSPAPNSLLTPDQLATQFVIREARRWSSGLGAGYLLVLPVAEQPVAWRQLPAAD